MEKLPAPNHPELELHTTVDTLGREQHFLINESGNKERITNDEFEEFLPRAVVSQTGLEVSLKQQQSSSKAEEGDDTVQSTSESSFLPTPTDAPIDMKPPTGPPKTPASVSAEVVEKSGKLYTLLLSKLEENLSKYGRDKIMENAQAKEAYKKDLVTLSQATAMESLHSNGGNQDLEDDIKAVFLNPNSVLARYGVKHEELVEAGIVDINVADPAQLNREQLIQQNRQDLKSLQALTLKERSEEGLTEEEQNRKTMLYGRIYLQNSHFLFEGKSRSDFNDAKLYEKEKLLESRMQELDALRDGKARLETDDNGEVRIIMLTPIELAGYGKYGETGVIVSDGEQFKGSALDRATDPEIQQSKSKLSPINARKNKNEEAKDARVNDSEHTDKRSRKKLALLGTAALGILGAGVVTNEIINDDSEKSVQVISSEESENNKENGNQSINEGDAEGSPNEQISEDITNTEEYKELEEKYKEDVQQLEKEIEELQEVLVSASNTNTSGEQVPPTSTDSGSTENTEETSGSMDDENNEDQEATNSSDLVTALRQENLSQYQYPWDWAQAHNFNIRELVAEAQTKGFNFSWNLQSDSDRDDILLYNGSTDTKTVLSALIDSLES